MAKQRTRLLSGALVWSVVALLFLGACGQEVDITPGVDYESVDRGNWAIGAHLSVNVSNVTHVSEVPYSSQGTNYVIRPRNPANQLTVAKVLIVNRKSSRVSLLIDEGAASLENRRLARFGPVNPFGTQRLEAEEASSEGNEYVPFLWGEVELEQDKQLEGWMIFETPPQLELYQLRWDQGESVFVRF